MNLEKVMSGLAGSGLLGGLAGGAVSGALMSNKKARKTAGTVLQVGGLAALGGMAWKAYQGYQAGNRSGQPESHTEPQAPDPAWSNLTDSGFAIDTDDQREDSRALLLVKAMIAAACADGHLDGDERNRIMQQVAEAGLDAREKGLVLDTLQDPPGLSDLCAQVDCPELAAEVYLASLLAVDSSRIESEIYLEALAHRLSIPPPLVAEMQAQLPSPTQAVA